MTSSFFLLFSISRKKNRHNWEFFFPVKRNFMHGIISEYTRKKGSQLWCRIEKYPNILTILPLFSLLATTSWYKNDEMVDMSYTTSGRESRNMYTFVASSEDNGARFRCEAKNEQIVQPMKTEILLKVQCRLFFFVFFY